MINRLKQLSDKFYKLSQLVNSDLTGTIERASSWAKFNIPDFRKIINEYNNRGGERITELSIKLTVTKDAVNVVSVSTSPSVNSNEINQMSNGLKAAIPIYFSKYRETIQNIVPGEYVVNYPF